MTAINPKAKTVTVDGETIPYDQLALTTGSRPRTLPAAIGGDLGNVFTVRTLADVDRMAPSFTKGARALIVGGGYIGLEAAAVASKLGSEGLHLSKLHRASFNGLPHLKPATISASCTPATGSKSSKAPGWNGCWVKAA